MKTMLATAILALTLPCWAGQSEQTEKEAQNIESAFHGARPKKVRILPVRLPQAEEKVKPLPVRPGEPEPVPLFTIPSAEDQALDVLGDLPVRIAHSYRRCNGPQCFECSDSCRTVCTPRQVTTRVCVTAGTGGVTCSMEVSTVSDCHESCTHVCS
ncbi:hypothetical protein HY772_03440 [Candidatus Woesearchaeota archaeon]|nr:hypothetical protein [Candidatus Woesearchaeota archaeon]